jgi:Helix-turn-helix domain.
VGARAYKFRAYCSKSTARVLETQLKTVCKLYNKLLHAEEEEYRNTKHTMGENELRQLALDLRKRNPESGAALAGCPAGRRKALPGTETLPRWFGEQAKEKEAPQIPLPGVSSEWLEAFKYQGGRAVRKQRRRLVCN